MISLFHIVNNLLLKNSLEANQMFAPSGRCNAIPSNLDFLK